MSSLFSEKKSEEFLRASSRGDLELVKSLSLDPEVDLNWKSRDGFLPFYLACADNHVDIVRYLLGFHDNQREPIDYNLVDQGGNTPLLIACSGGRQEVVEILVEDQRIDVNRPNKREKTPLYWASYHGHVGMVKMMLASTRPIDPLKKYEGGKTAADIARERGTEAKLSWEAEGRFQERKKGCQLIAPLLESYQSDPQAVKERLRKELGIDRETNDSSSSSYLSSLLPFFFFSWSMVERWAGELFALVVFLSDGYLEIPAETRGEEIAQRRKNPQRFFNLASLLPLDLQMVLCNRAFGLGVSIVKRIHSEQGFKKFVRVEILT